MQSSNFSGDFCVMTDKTQPSSPVCIRFVELLCCIPPPPLPTPSCSKLSDSMEKQKPARERITKRGDEEKQKHSFFSLSLIFQLAKFFLSTPVFATPVYPNAWNKLVFQWQISAQVYNETPFSLSVFIAPYPWYWAILDFTHIWRWEEFWATLLGQSLWNTVKQDYNEISTPGTPPISPPERPWVHWDRIAIVVGQGNWTAAVTTLCARLM